MTARRITTSGWRAAAVVSIGAPPPGGGADAKPLAYTGVQVVGPEDAELFAARRAAL